MTDFCMVPIEGGRLVIKTLASFNSFPETMLARNELCCWSSNHSSQPSKSNRVFMPWQEWISHMVSQAKDHLCS